MSNTLNDVLEHIDQHLEESLGRLEDFLRIPSVGTDPSHDEDTRAAATFAAELLSGIGMEAGVRDTSGQPMVVAHDDGPGEGSMYEPETDARRARDPSSQTSPAASQTSSQY